MSKPQIIKMLAPVFKDAKTGEYLATLSDTTMDRDKEFIGKEAYSKTVNSGKKFAAMLDHENKVLNKVGDWQDHVTETIDGNTILVSKCNFTPYLDNPNAQLIKSALDKGGSFDISIGAIVNDFVMVKDADGKERRKYTDIEIIEASYVGIGSNRGSSTKTMALAKKYQESHSSNNKEMTNHMENNSTEELTKQLETNKEELTKTQSKNSDLTKQFEETNKALAEVQKELEEQKAKSLELEKAVKSAEEAQEAANKSASDAETTLKEAQDKLKSVPKHFYDATAANKMLDGANEEIAKGKIPVLTR